MEIFKSLDVDGKGYLTVDEFVSFCRHSVLSAQCGVDTSSQFVDTVPSSGDSRSRDLFDCLDRNADGRIDAGDFVEGLRRFGVDFGIRAPAGDDDVAAIQGRRVRRDSSVAAWNRFADEHVDVASAHVESILQR